MAFLRLIRVQNLALIALTMLGVSLAVLERPLTTENRVSYALFIASTALIAAAGNAINDYFDLRADRLNRPNTVVIGKRLKKRWAIIIHWGFNAAGLAISLILSIRYHSWFFLFIHLFSATMLWVYSVYLKKVLFWSNVSIAVLVSIVPLISLIFFMILDVEIRYFELIGLFSIVAFIGNLAREMLKDIQDMEGDHLINVRSVPLVYGEKMARLMVSILCFACCIPFGWTLYQHSNPTMNVFFEVFTISILICSITGFFSLLGTKAKLLALMLKISMLMAVISLFFL